jgi:hypothetical protein
VKTLTLVENKTARKALIVIRACGAHLLKEPKKQNHINAPINIQINIYQRVFLLHFFFIFTTRILILRRKCSHRYFIIDKIHPE